MKILIFGSTGFLGKKLIKLLDKQKNLRILKAVRKQKNINDNHSLYSDLQDSISIKKTLNLLSPDIVVNLGA